MVSMNNLEYFRRNEIKSDKDVRYFLSGVAKKMKPNILLTLNAKRNYFYNSYEDSKVDKYDEFQRSVAVFIIKLAKLILTEKEYSRKYEDWFPFFAFFEDRSKTGEYCTPHYHIVVRVPCEKIDYILSSDKFISIWLEEIGSENRKNYDCVKIEEGSEMNISDYVSKYSFNSSSILYSITNRDIRSIVQRKRNKRKIFSIN